MAYHTKLEINGVEFPIAVNITGKGAPTEATEGRVGMLYMNELDGSMYKCIGENQWVVLNALTEADIENIASRAVILIKNNGVVGVVDTDNNIILSGAIANGTYTLKYENEDGTYSEVGTLTVGEVSTDDPEDNPETDLTEINLFTAYAPILNQRYSNTSKAWKGQNGCVGFELPMADIVGKTMRFSGFQTYYAGDTTAQVAWYAVNDSNTAVATYSNIFNLATNEGDNTYSWVVPSVEGATKLMVFLSIANALINESNFADVSWILTD